jgi:hypothetical protein
MASGLTHAEETTMATRIIRYLVLLAPASVFVIVGLLPGTAQAAVREACIGDAAPVTEGNAGSTVMASFKISMCQGNGTMTINWATSNGTATAPADYTSSSGSVTIGNAGTTVTVPVVGDTLDENDETFLVNLSGGAVQAGSGSGTGTITDDDAAPSLSINNVSVAEGNAGTSSAIFTVSMSPISARTISVDWATANDTALAPVDYAAGTGTLTFNPGQTAKTVQVTASGDTTDEPDETFFVNLSNPTNATIADAQGLGTIADDDAPPTVSIGNASVPEGNTGTAPATFTVSLSAASGKTVTVEYASANGTATAPADYAAVGTTILTFTPGQLSKTVTVNAQGDVLDEADETFSVNLSNAVNASIAGAPGAGVITDDDPLPRLSINDVTVTEGDAGTVAASFTLTLAPVSGRNVTIDYGTADATAVQPGDYTSTNNTLTFTPGQTTKTVTVNAKGDTTDEIDETFAVNLTNAVNATITDAQGTGTITDDDLPPTLSLGNASVAEGDTGTSPITFTVFLSGASGKTVAVDYTTSDLSATQPADYATATGTVTFTPGQTSRIATVNAKGDTIDEEDETLAVDLSNPSNATLAGTQGMGTITDDDAPPSISVNDATAVEGNAGTTPATFTVSLAGPSAKPISVDYAISDGTAEDPDDFTSTSGTLTFDPGDVTKQVSVDVKGDTLNEADETFTVDLSNAFNATITGGAGTVTIDNDDPVVDISIDDVTTLEGDAGTTQATFTVELSDVSGQPVTVDYATSDASAVDPDDYTATNGTLVFDPDDTMKQVTVDVAGDVLNEANEMFSVGLANASHAAITGGAGTATITDNDPIPDVSVDDVALTEGNAGTADATFTVTLSPVSGRVVTVNYATVDDSATSPDDYASTSGILTFNPGETSRTVDVPVKGEAAVELPETFTLELSAPSHANIVKGTGVGTINDNDPDPDVSINDVSVTEGDSGATQAVFTVSLAGASFRPISVDYATSDGTAVDPDDFTSTSGTLTFDPGDVTKQVSVDVKGDTLTEIDETYSVVLTDASNATITGGSGIGTIIDDDRLPTSLTLKVKKTKARIAANGTVLNAEVGMRFTVKLQKKKGAKYVKGLSRTALIRTTTDANLDGVLEGRLSTKFKRPTAGAYRFVVTFAGDGTHLPVTATKKFKI